MGKLFLWLAGLILPFLAQLGIGVAVGGVVYTFFVGVVQPKLNSIVDSFLSASDSQYASIGTYAMSAINYVGIPLAISLVAASWSVCMALRVFRMSLSFIKVTR